LKQFPHHAFREYDIRGIAGADITEELAYRLGKAYASMLPEGETSHIAVGRDVRLSGPELQAAVMRGLTDAGLWLAASWSRPAIIRAHIMASK